MIFVDYKATCRLLPPVLHQHSRHARSSRQNIYQHGIDCGAAPECQGAGGNFEQDGQGPQITHSLYRRRPRGSLLRPFCPLSLSPSTMTGDDLHTRTNHPSCSLSSSSFTMSEDSLYTHRRNGTQWSDIHTRTLLTSFYQEVRYRPFSIGEIISHVLRPLALEPEIFLGLAYLLAFDFAPFSVELALRSSSISHTSRDHISRPTATLEPEISLSLFAYFPAFPSRSTNSRCSPRCHITR